MSSQEEGNRALAEHWEERERKEREARKSNSRRLIVVGDHSPEEFRGEAA